MNSVGPNFGTNTNLYMKLIATKSENWDFFFTLCSINLKMISICGTRNTQPVFNLGPCVKKHLWCDIIESSIFLDGQFLARWIGRESPYITWPARSPDLTPPDFFFLVGFVKGQVYRTPVRHLSDLKEIIYTAFNNVTPQTLRNRCVEVQYLLDISPAT